MSVAAATFAFSLGIALAFSGAAHAAFSLWQTHRKNSR